jgi:hypothetical protein
MPEVDPWPAYRRRRRSLRLVLLAALPALMVAAWLWPSPLVWVLGSVWLIALFYTATELESLACPRCRRLFFRAGAWHDSFATQCLNCGLHKWLLADGTLSPAKHGSTSRHREHGQTSVPD